MQLCQSSVAVTGFAEIGGEPFGEGVAALGSAGMDADLLEIEEGVQQPHVPVGGAPRADMAEHARALPGQVFCAEGGQRAGAHVGDGGGVEDRLRRAGAGVEQIEDAELGRQAVAVVVDEVADDLHAGRLSAAQHSRAAR